METKAIEMEMEYKCISFNEKEIDIILNSLENFLQKLIVDYANIYKGLNEEEQLNLFEFLKKRLEEVKQVFELQEKIKKEVKAKC